MATSCPIFIHALASRGRVYPSEYTKEGRISINALCIRDNCQMWNPETQDCGLKQVPVTSVLEEIKSTLEEISQDVEIIKNNVE